MRHAKKTKALLELERSISEHPSTLLEAGRKIESITVEEARPRLLIIAEENNLKLHLKRDYDKALNIFYDEL